MKDLKWWKSLTPEQQKEYLKLHRASKLKRTFAPPKVSTLSSDSPFVSFLKLFSSLISKKKTDTKEKTNLIKGSHKFLEEFGLPKRKFNKVVEGDEDYYKDFRKSLKKKLPSILKDSSIPRSQIELLNNSVMKWLRDPSSEKARTYLSTNIDVLGDKNLSSKFVSKSSYTQPISKILNLTKKLTGKEKITLSPDEAKRAREKNPESYKQYMALRKESKEVFIDLLRDTIRKEGSDYVSTKDINELVKEHGIELSTVPTGFKGNIGVEEGKIVLYTKGGMKINGIPAGNVSMNPDYKDGVDSFVFTSTPFNGESTLYYYTVDHKKKADEKKFGAVESLTDKEISKLKNTWRSDIKEGNNLNEALITELCYQTSIRIGGKGNKTKGKNTYGLSTMLTKQLKFTDEGMLFNFVGKAGVKHSIKVPYENDPFTKTTASTLKKLVKGNERNDPIFKGARGSSIEGSKVNAYLKGIGFPGTIKYFRTLKGTQTVRDMLSDSSVPRQQNVDKFLKGIYEKAGKALGHKNKDGKTLWSTSAQHYVSPKVVTNWLHDNGLREPKWLDKIIKAREE